MTSTEIRKDLLSDSGRLHNDRVSSLRLTRDNDPHRLLDDPVVAEIAKKHKRSPAQVSKEGS